MLRPALLACLVALPAAAADPINASRQWAAFVEEEAEGRHCFAGTVPMVDGVEGTSLRRDPAYLTVSFWPELRRTGEVSIMAGFPLKRGEPVTVVVDIGSAGTRSFELISRDERAWTAGPDEDAELIAAMRDGGKMTVRGVSANDNEVVDEYSLWGFTAMLRAAEAACTAE